ncbi:PRC-barrel domain-containing protein [Francisella tularensis]|uniref:PRC-barrel domain-containing protein n=1 Tax=Francisella tularensis TaxID=263 RepID=UPI00030D8902|nr:PRC-barrel domain-containing protein [Francisella tularensis]AJI45146.1 PRC-barrel domain protein [Francisella tularensis subsp. novicida F6168]AJJ47750.1 PRC-barrel domain protein [Francisella tularensis subsp. novicida]APC99457.1 PRC-barrel domain protein [Francisella tularensis subsp. novicida]KFJ68001.1 PRC-barrel domain protein [Francisella tularensis subsp. novicida]
MKKTKLILVSTLLASGLVSGYSEENDNTSIFRTTNHNEQKISNLALPASHLIGEKVVNYKGENLGKVKEIMINPNTGKVAYVVVSYGGFLGMGDKLFAFPIKAFKVDTANAQFKIKKTKEELEEAPGFDKNNWPETSSDYW